MNTKLSKKGSISKTIVIGFFAIILITFTFTLYIMYELQEVKSLSSRVRDLRTPTFEASSSLQSNIFAAQSSLRGLILTNEPRMNESFRKNWVEINKNIGKMKELSANWTNPENNKKLELIENNLEELSKQQNNMIAIYTANKQRQMNIGNQTTSPANNTPNREIMALGSETTEIGIKIIGLLNEVVANQKLLQQNDNIALDNKIDQLRFFVLLASAMVVIFSVSLAYLITRRIERVEGKIIERNHLIDQNILISTIDKEGKVLEISNSLCRELGKAREDLIGKQYDFLINGEDKENQINDINSIIKTGFRWEGEISITKLNGEVHWYSSTIIPLSDISAEQSGFTNILVNITDKKHNELLSITDKLTGIFNRRHFDKTLEKQIHISRRQKSFLSLAIIDIDYFKQYNDHYGHPEGDRVLRNVAQTLRRSLNRPDDFAFRLGGEEFGIIFSASDLEQSQIFLEKIKDTIEGLHIKHEKSDLGAYLTISIGAVCTNGTNIPSAADYYNISDNALYEAKIKRNSLEIVGL